MTKEFYLMNEKEVLETLETSVDGLTTDEANKRTAQYGQNKLDEEVKESLVMKYVKQFKSTMVIILIIATFIAVAIGEFTDALVILMAVIINTIMGFRQEYKAEKAMDALKKLTVQKVEVLRDGERKEISAAELVPGDVFFLSEGVKIQADGRVISEIELEVDESILTGESVPVIKDAVNFEKEMPVAERRNSVYAGTIVTRGKAEVVVTFTGMHTEIGRIAKLIRDVEEEETNLQKKLNELGKHIAIFALAMAIILFSFQMIKHYLAPHGIPVMDAVFEAMLSTVSLAVAIVPEGLPVVVIVTLAISMQIMAKKNAVVRRLSCAETLGATTVICSDKTGTLTKNEMTVQEIHLGTQEAIICEGEGYDPAGRLQKGGRAVKADEDKHLALLLKCGMLCNDAHLLPKDEKWSVVGDPMEGSLLTVGIKGGLKLKIVSKDYPRTDEILFEPNRKMMTTIHYAPSDKSADTAEGHTSRESVKVAFSKGAPESVLGKCKFYYDKGEAKELTDSKKQELMEINKQMADKTYRVLAFAFKPLPDTYEKGEAEKNMTFLGMVGIIDPPREEVALALKKCRTAGIRVLMITGDQKNTAYAIAKKIGLSDDPRVVTGMEIDKMSKEEFEKIVKEVSIFARVTPEHKLAVVKALKAQGQVVAVTGDGINDAPALKTADIGISMGITGTDVAKEASSMVLMDDNFTTIVSAVEEGRRIFDNIRRFIQFQLSTNVSAILLIFVGLLIGLPLPLLPTQLLWINIMMDGPPAVALGVEPATGNVMTKHPRKKDEKILSGPIITRIAILGAIMGIGALLIYKYYLGDVTDPLNPVVPKARTVVFTAFVMFQLIDVINCRSISDSVFTLGFFRNRSLIIAISTAFLLQMMIVYVDAFRPYFRTVPLAPTDLLLAIGLASSVFVIEEIRKAVFRKYNIWHDH